MRALFAGRRLGVIPLLSRGAVPAGHGRDAPADRGESLRGDSRQAGKRLVTAQPGPGAQLVGHDHRPDRRRIAALQGVCRRRRRDARRDPDPLPDLRRHVPCPRLCDGVRPPAANPARGLHANRRRRQCAWLSPAEARHGGGLHVCRLRSGDRQLPGEFHGRSGRHGLGRRDRQPVSRLLLGRGDDWSPLRRDRHGPHREPRPQAAADGGDRCRAAGARVLRHGAAVRGRSAADQLSPDRRTLAVRPDDRGLPGGVCRRPRRPFGGAGSVLGHAVPAAADRRVRDRQGRPLGGPRHRSVQLDHVVQHLHPGNR